MVGFISIDNQNTQPFTHVFLDDVILLQDDKDSDLILRKQLLNEISREIGQLAEGRVIPNFLFYGQQGCGKTTLLKRLMYELEGKSCLKCVYVDCWSYYTRMAVYHLIARTLGQVLPRRGLATDEVFDRIVETLEKTHEKVIVFLDGVDGLIFNHQQMLLYKLAELREKKQLFCFIAACDDKRGFNELNARRKMPLRLSEIEVKPLDMKQLAEIIAWKAKRALKPGSYDSKVINALTAKASEGNDLEMALYSLWKAGYNAEKFGRNKICLTDLGGKSKKLGEAVFAVKSLKERLSVEENFIISILSKGTASSTSVYAEFQAKFKLSKRQVRNYLTRLVEKNLIRSIEQPEARAFFKARLYFLNV